MPLIKYEIYLSYRQWSIDLKKASILYRYTQYPNTIRPINIYLSQILTITVEKAYGPRCFLLDHMTLELTDF